MSTNSFLVISLDFELYWGMFDKVSLEAYGKNIRGVHTAIPEMLQIFDTHDIHATWACVGMLLCENKQALIDALPPQALRPIYQNMRLSAYEHIAKAHIGENLSDDLYHYGAVLARKIIATKNQEFGSHTFSHYYCQDGSENAEGIFAADCEAFKAVSTSFRPKVTSIVFPRNQTTNAALATITRLGFTAYRGTPTHFLYTGKAEAKQTNPLLRLLRLFDAYINISGHHTFKLATVSHTGITGLKNVPGSRFLRPYSHTLRIFEKLKLSRIKKSMTYAAKHNEIFHLWWHPHNVGINRKENMRALLEIIAHYKELQKKYNMQSATMAEIVLHARTNCTQQTFRQTNSEVS
jgi:peptidoglycan/xylan/chitin deacetylase (PgdA/CDA1 family)